MQLCTAIIAIGEEDSCPHLHNQLTRWVLDRLNLLTAVTVDTNYLPCREVHDEPPGGVGAYGCHTPIGMEAAAVSGVLKQDGQHE